MHEKLLLPKNSLGLNEKFLWRVSASWVQSFNLGGGESFRNGYGDGCTARWMQLISLNYTLKMVKIMKFMLYIVSQ